MNGVRKIRGLLALTLTLSLFGCGYLDSSGNNARGGDGGSVGHRDLDGSFDNVVLDGSINPGPSPGPSGDSGVGAGNAGTANCVDVWRCAVSCHDDTCVNDCVRSGTTVGTAFGRALANCSRASGCGSDSCLYTNCPTEYSACARDGTPGSWPSTWTGGEWSRGTRPPSDGGGGGSGGSSGSSGSGGSSGSSGSGGSSGGGGSGGTGGTFMCGDIVGCASHCSASNPNPCRFQCRTYGTSAEQTKYDALFSCMVTNNCSDTTCMLALCSSQIGACRQNGKSCSLVLQCADGCTDDACEQICINMGTPYARSLIDLIIDCGQRYNCTNPSCLLSNCSGQVQACMDI